MQDSKQRFSDRVADYSAYRPSYPQAIIEGIRNTLRPGVQVPRAADLGSGTGIFSRELLAGGFEVWGVEPNREMRAAAERELGAAPRFHSLDAEAGKTGLPEASMDLVCAAQSFHWFANAETVGEISRILAPGAMVALVWNERMESASGFSAEFEGLVRTYCRDYENSSHKNLGSEVIRGLFEGWDYRSISVANDQNLSLEQWKGRLKSSSYCPKPHEPGYPELMSGLDALFAQYSSLGIIHVPYRSKCHFLSRR